MKRILAVCVVVTLVVGMSIPILAQEGTEASTKFIEVLASQLTALLDADSVLGTKIEFEGTTIIPIVARGFGFGGGSGGGGDEKGQGAGTGVGAGGGVMPLSFLVISKDGEISIVSAKKGELGEIIKAAAPMIMGVIEAGQEAQPQPEPSAEEETEEPKQE